MFTGLKPYPEYENRGPSRLSHVPSPWSVRRLKHIVRNVVEQSDTRRSGDTYIALERVESWTGRVRIDDSATFEGLIKNFSTDDVLFGKLRPYLAKVVRVDFDGVCSGEFFVLRRVGDAVASDFLELVMRSAQVINEISSSTFGARMPRAEWAFVGGVLLALPSQAEQEAIVKFLGHANARIDRAIASKRKMLSLLDEQKGAVVQEAVTAGLDATVDRHSSSSNWFPSLPAGWEMTTLGRLVVSAIDGPHFSPEYLDDGVPFLSARNVKEGHWDFSDVNYVSPEDFELFSKRVKPELGDVLYTKGGTTGVARVVDLTFPFQIWVHVAVLKPHKKLVTPDYLAMTLNSPRCYEQSQLYTRGATNQDLGLSRMKRIELPLPPSLHEQGRVVQHVRHQVDTLLTAATRVVREIELLREFRTRLTSDAVTGQLDVCEAAAKLPDLDLTELATVDIDDSDDIDAVAEEFLDEDEP